MALILHLCFHICPSNLFLNSSFQIKLLKSNHNGKYGNNIHHPPSITLTTFNAVNTNVSYL